MAIKDLHDEPFDEGTIAKLEIFEDYAQAWIPTFVMSGVQTICIFDFFAGTGYDKNGVAGSPIRILQKINEHIGNIFQKRVKVKVYLNEFEPVKKEQLKFQMLKDACEKYLEANKSLKNVIEIVYHNEDCETLFPKLIDTIKQYPALVYLDQNGIKFLSDKYFLELEKAKQTDFLYFVSSSFLKRFGESKEFQSHLEVDFEAVKQSPYRFIHRFILDYLRKRLPANSKLKLYPFSIKKGTNIYGIIFGASHPRAVDKFLSVVWKKNEKNGEANFDIDEDSKKDQIDLFEGQKLNKIDKFKENVRTKILSKELTNNFEVYNYVLAEGHIGNHASECIKLMKKEGKVKYDSTSPLVTYDNVYKNNKKIDYKI